VVVRVGTAVPRPPVTAVVAVSVPNPPLVNVVVVVRFLATPAASVTV
jgi:hypothetical protein